MNDDFDALVLVLTASGVRHETAATIVRLRLGSALSPRPDTIVEADARLVEAGLPEETLLHWAQQGIITRDLPDLLTGPNAYAASEIADAVDSGVSLHALLKSHAAGIRYPATRAAWDATRGNHTWHYPIARLVDSGDLTDEDLRFLAEVTFPPLSLRSRSGVSLEKALAGATGTTRQAIVAGTMIDGDVVDGICLAERLAGKEWADVAVRLLLDGRSVGDALKHAEAVMRTPEQQAAIDQARQAEQQAARRDQQRAVLIARLEWHARTGTPIEDRWLGT